ncbi:NUDIX hydrolase [Ornithinimicrobium kibberense]|uniref:NUDIX domain-containing protein n=1 Tax=Ornithinimicrobium kibberense TaxID=282060 RepID=A0ABV5V296_9MICO|nr:NUDIX hydrolase [Ornithinimicrobium kibberense]
MPPLPGEGPGAGRDGRDEPVLPGNVRRRTVAPGVVELVGLSHLPADPTDAVDLVVGLVERSFGDGHHRVEAQVDVDDHGTRRVLQRAGLRPEGVARGRAAAADGPPGDVLRLGRLRDDPSPGTPAGFLGMLNATLPTKRLIVQGLVRDDQGRVLLCELTYKRDWDLVGGVAEPAETPVASLEREVCEELGVDLPVGDLLAVDWLPPYKQWADALLLVFDLGVHPDLLDRAVLQRTELRSVHWCTLAEAADHVAPYVARLLTSLAEAEAEVGGTAGGAGPLFLEDGLPRRTAPG